jgi:hypothetical protein
VKKTSANEPWTMRAAAASGAKNASEKPSLKIAPAIRQESSAARLASTQVPGAPTVSAVPVERAICEPSAKIHTRSGPAKRTALTSPSASLCVQSGNIALPAAAETGMSATGVQVSPVSVDRSTRPSAPTAKPTGPPSWNSMSSSRVPAPA